MGCSCYLGLGSAAPTPRFLGTQPPYATQALNEVKYTYLTYLMTRSMLCSSERGIFGSLLWHFLSGFGVTFVGWCRAVSWEPGYACAITCGRSFTVLSVWGVLISFWSVLVFSPTLLSPFYYYNNYNLSLLLLLLLALCDGCLDWGWV